MDVPQIAESAANPLVTGKNPPSSHPQQTTVTIKQIPDILLQLNQDIQYSPLPGEKSVKALCMEYLGFEPGATISKLDSTQFKEHVNNLLNLAYLHFSTKNDKGYSIYTAQMLGAILCSCLNIPVGAYMEANSPFRWREASQENKTIVDTLWKQSDQYVDNKNMPAALLTLKHAIVKNESVTHHKALLYGWRTVFVQHQDVDQQRGLAGYDRCVNEDQFIQIFLFLIEVHLEDDVRKYGQAQFVLGMLWYLVAKETNNLHARAICQHHLFTASTRNSNAALMYFALIEASFFPYEQNQYDSALNNLRNSVARDNNGLVCQKLIELHNNKTIKLSATECEQYNNYIEQWNTQKGLVRLQDQIYEKYSLENLPISLPQINSESDMADIYRSMESNLTNLTAHNSNAGNLEEAGNKEEDDRIGTIIVQAAKDEANKNIPKAIGSLLNLFHDRNVQSKHKEAVVILLARLYCAQHQYGKAVDIYSEAIRNHNKYANSLISYVFETYIMHGDWLCTKKDYSKAIKQYELALTKPDDLGFLERTKMKIADAHIEQHKNSAFSNMFTGHLDNALISCRPLNSPLSKMKALEITKLQDDVPAMLDLIESLLEDKKFCDDQKNQSMLWEHLYYANSNSVDCLLRTAFLKIKLYTAYPENPKTQRYWERYDGPIRYLALHANKKDENALEFIFKLGLDQHPLFKEKVDQTILKQYEQKIAANNTASTMLN